MARGENPETTPVADLGFFALGAVVITTGLVVQLRAPERKIAGVQQAVLGLLALGIAGLIGARIEPLAGAVVFLAGTGVLVVLHPARGAFFTVGRRPSVPLAALALLAALPATAYAATMLVQARQAGPSCFLGRCAYGDRFAELAASAVAVVALGLFAASKPRGSRVTAWSAGAAAVTLGAASVVWPDLPGSFGRTAGAVAILWGVLFVAVAEREARGTAPASLERPASSSAGLRGGAILEAAASTPSSGGER